MAKATRNAQCRDRDQGEANCHSATTNAMMGEISMNVLAMNVLAMSGTGPDV